jgi:F420-0:gamma-glutamyl ligase
MAYYVYSGETIIEIGDIIPLDKDNIYVKCNGRTVSIYEVNSREEAEEMAEKEGETLFILDGYGNKRASI